MRLWVAGLAVFLSTIPRQVARVFTACFGVGAGESGSGRQTTDFVTAERLPLTPSLHFLQSSETLYRIDAGSTVARLVHNHAVESQSVS